MEFTQVTAKSPEKLVDALGVLERTVSIKTLCGMMWQPHGGVVIVGYEKHAPVARAAKKRTRRNLVKELETVKGDIGELGETDLHADLTADSGSTKAD